MHTLLTCARAPRQYSSVLYCSAARILLREFSHKLQQLINMLHGYRGRVSGLFEFLNFEFLMKFTAHHPTHPRHDPFCAPVGSPGRPPTNNVRGPHPSNRFAFELALGEARRRSKDRSARRAAVRTRPRKQCSHFTKGDWR